MNPTPLFLALAVLSAALPAAAAEIKCPPGVTGGVSNNWGQDYREHVTDIFIEAKAVAGVDQNVLLIDWNDLKIKSAGARTVQGSPISAMPKGTLGLQSDAVIYAFGVFEIACDEPQLATFMLHEMRHLKVVDGKNHFDRVLACRKDMINEWAKNTDLSAYPDTPEGRDAAIAAFDKAKGADYQKKCVLPVENEADQFAFANLPKMHYKTDPSTSGDPNRDARAQAFKNAESWAIAIHEDPCDGGHGCLGDRAKSGAAAAAAQREQQRVAAERMKGMSIDPSAFRPE